MCEFSLYVIIFYFNSWDTIYFLYSLTISSLMSTPNKSAIFSKLVKSG